jgi:hypothetical protein
MPLPALFPHFGMLIARSLWPISRQEFLSIEHQEVLSSALELNRFEDLHWKLTLPWKAQHDHQRSLPHGVAARTWECFPQPVKVVSRAPSFWNGPTTHYSAHGAGRSGSSPLGELCRAISRLAIMSAEILPYQRLGVVYAGFSSCTDSQIWNRQQSHFTVSASVLLEIGQRALVVTVQW